ncbi:MAG TPA: hypothetical protein VFA56_04565 [Gaiellaceae bacterium]|nr:hypothetical protein [Gaiellaceae bacterium]
MLTMITGTAAAGLEVGDTVRLTQVHEQVPAGAEGRVVGFYRVEPPQTLVAFETGHAPVLDRFLERVA